MAFENNLICYSFYAFSLISKHRYVISKLFYKRLMKNFPLKMRSQRFTCKLNLFISSCHQFYLISVRMVPFHFTSNILRSKECFINYLLINFYLCNDFCRYF